MQGCPGKAEQNLPQETKLRLALLSSSNLGGL